MPNVRLTPREREIVRRLADEPDKTMEIEDLFLYRLELAAHWLDGWHITAEGRAAVLRGA